MNQNTITHYYCHDFPDTLSLSTDVLDVEPGKVLVSTSPFFPGGGGQLPDRGVLINDGEPIAVQGTRITPEGVWHTIDHTCTISPTVELIVDELHRHLQSELHTLAHIVNAIVFQEFNGALLTGAQLNGDGTFRMDFDLPDVDNSRLRALESTFNDIVERDLEVTTYWMPWHDAQAQPGLFRAKFATPPKNKDGTVRIVKIGEIDRQACVGTHVSSTGQCRDVHITKVENKGRQNRRLRLTV